MPRGTRTLILNPDRTYVSTGNGYHKEGTYVIKRDLFSINTNPKQPKDMIKFDGNSWEDYVEIVNGNLRVREGCCAAYTYEK
ncbi:hypothetical protein GCM10023183_31590 [Nibribacter koreensis]|uniref:Uncharacterized protein n=2 Tax=Nibribacter koreensis TaxID=1084519 RepID=A0ABP8FWK6_9BACT